MGYRQENVYHDCPAITMAKHHVYVIRNTIEEKLKRSGERFKTERCVNLGCHR